MLDNEAVLAKTDLGREAIARRTHNLGPRQRALLISINGETNVGQLLARFGAEADAVRTMLQGLLDHSLVEPVGGFAAAVESPSPLPTAPDARPSMADGHGAGAVAGAGTTAESPLTAADPVPPAAGNAVPPSGAAASLVEPEADPASAIMVDWRRCQQRAGDTLHELMGDQADLLAMRLFRARTQSEFESHLERAFELVDRAHGPDAREAFRRSVLAG
jgi:hypothetical protein